MNAENIMNAVPFTVMVGADTVGDFYKTKENTYVSDRYHLTVETELTHFAGTGAVRQVNTVTNTGTKPVLLTGISGAGIRTAHGTVCVSQNRWQAEGQWQYLPMETLGLVPTSVHPWERGVYRISSVGSNSTYYHYPLTMVCGDDGVTYYMELEGGNNWMLEHVCTGGFGHPVYLLEGFSAHEENGGWTYPLGAGESYRTQPAVFGAVRGGFEEAVAELLVYKRATSVVRHLNGTIPVVFNDYMNCLWGQPSGEKLYPLIDAAAAVGAEYFCIDAGWHKNAGTTGGNGDWIVANEKFGEGGLAAVFAHMKEKGLKPGVWFELENVQETAAAYHLGEGCLLTRYDGVIPYAFFDFRNEKVRAHIASRIDALYNMGVRYIKNDYNKTTGLGCDAEKGSPAQGLIDSHRAFVTFIDEMIRTHDGLIIENCGSGGRREDHGTLRHFFVQSTSDQEIYYLYPSIITGSLAQLAPEKAGIWSYPMPVLFDEMNAPHPSEAWSAQFADGEQTIFNMVNGMCGVLYQSGRLDLADEKNLGFVKEGIAKYKEMRGDTMVSHPVFPTGTVRIGERGFATVGLETPAKDKLYLAVWRIGGDTDTVSVDLSRYGYKKAEGWFPCNTPCDFDGATLRAVLPATYSARMFVLTK